LLQFLKTQGSSDSGIVYCLSRKKTEEIAEFLCAKGFHALPYHAGLTSEMRDKHQDIFLKNEGVIVVATIAFGMGIDKPDVRYVCHLDLPKSVEAYYQETGRAGRDGLPAKAWMVYGLSDLVMLKRMIDESEAPQERKFVEHRKLNALLGICETAECRRKVLLGYFGDVLDEPCMNCDTCLHPVPTWEGSKEAQLALSCVYRSGQRFGVAHLVDILLGKETQKIAQFRHNTLSVFGQGAHKEEKTWFSVFRQLIAAGTLQVDVAGYGALKLCEASRAILKGEQAVQFRVDVAAPKKLRESKKKIKEKLSSSKSSGADSAVAADFNDEEKELFGKLRQARMKLAKAQNVPPYVIFHDATLKEMVRRRPRSEAEMLEISGVGEHKFARYGKMFLGVIEGGGE
jgi:ATP-dependent DNA helicase RecQ